MISLEQDSNKSAESVWGKWSPSKLEPWDVRRVVHLHRRAGFGATWNEIQRDLADGHDASIARLMSGQAYRTAVPEDFDSTAELIGTSAIGSGNPNRLQAWWLYRMLFSPDPLGERLALMWHDHFATSNHKVEDIRSMHRQNQLFRQYGRGDYARLCTNVIRDPAMLIYLDANSNRKSHANENLGREMLELFTVGTGNFEESDVAQAARALTGWNVKDDKLVFVPEHHDLGEKMLLGKRGNFDGDDALRISLEHPATARRITRRICRLFMGEDVVSEPALTDLAKMFADQRMNVSWLVETILSSKLFFIDANIGNRVRGATEFVVSTIRSLGAMVPPPSTLVVADWTTKIGQRLFYPPNVFGFPIGREWINSQWMISRINFVHHLLEGKLHRKPFDLVKGLKESGLTSSDLSNAQLLGSHLLSVDETKFLQDTNAKSGSDTKQMLRMILTSPLAQLG